MDGVRSVVDGLDETVAALRKLDTKMQTRVFKAAAKDGAKMVLPIAISLAPHASGLLESKIQIRSSSRPSKGIFKSSVGVDAKDWTGQTFYASFVLWGHYAGSRKLGSKRKWIPGDDFLKIAAEEAGEQAANAMIQTMADGVNNV